MSDLDDLIARADEQIRLNKQVLDAVSVGDSLYGKTVRGITQYGN